MSGKSIRLSKLFNAKSGNSIIIPFDHGGTHGAIKGLEDPYKIVKKSIDLGIEGILMHNGLAKATQDMFEDRNAPARILTIDYVLRTCIPGRPSGIYGHGLLRSEQPALDALLNSVEAVKVLLIWGLDKNTQMSNIKIVANIADQCDRWQIPFMVEPVLWGDGISSEDKNNPDLIENAARISFELGADILKIPYTGDKNNFAQIVDRLKIPVLVLGGPKMKNIRDAFQVAADAIEAGAKGVVFGRNVWQNPEMDKVVQVLQEIVHNKVDVDEAMKISNLQLYLKK